MNQENRTWHFRSSWMSWCRWTSAPWHFMKQPRHHDQVETCQRPLALKTTTAHWAWLPRALHI
ncbi:hypothetical protein B0T16DRAFT_423802 [Cercophora newfieldiana]|uniref:Uncharacterized protein n=1 Tax=Cercophora newfieldiana TaxID=92897 RepID=A0AA39XTA7_9PEZI|nr:hypothetical protein B0T16DRAFT_423802 [Cercophora newfieldiana]